MRINDFEKMQQNLERMKSNLNNIQYAEIPQKNDNEVKSQILSGNVFEEKNDPNPEHTVAMKKLARDEHIILITTFVIVAITGVFSSKIFAQSLSENVVQNQVQTENSELAELQNVSQNNTIVATVNKKEEKNQANEKTAENIVFEENEDIIQLEDILEENVSVLKSKEYAEEVRDVDFEIIYNDNASLPKGEEIVIQEGIKGKEQVTVIKSYENDELVSENILERIPIEESTPQITDLGTSEFLAEKKVHLGDTMYLTSEAVLRENADENSNEIRTILQSMDVVLEELHGDWAKVKYRKSEGFLQIKDLTSSEVNPEIVEANRIQRIKVTLKESMALNKSTKLTLEDYKKILSGNSQDKNKVIEENAEVFYNMDKTYNLNGVFLASMAIHESGWGTSTIANDKKNLFGYGAYDSSPYESSYGFESYADGIEVVAKVLVKYYLNEAGTPIFDDQTAKGTYYNGSTIEDVNKRYASDQDWHNKIFKYMTYLYNRL